VPHYKRLRECRDSIVRLRDQASHLGDKLAAVVWQLPSNFTIDLTRLDDFLAALQAWRIRHALELRHASWFIPAVAARLRAADVAVCMGDATPRATRYAMLARTRSWSMRRSACTLRDGAHPKLPVHDIAAICFLADRNRCSSSRAAS